MKIWAEHQISQQKKKIECPMCRNDFGPISELRKEFINSSYDNKIADPVHRGIKCNNCNITEISGKCYK